MTNETIYYIIGLVLGGLLVGAIAWGLRGR